MIITNRSQAKCKLNGHSESDDSIIEDQDRRPLDTHKMNNPVLPLMEKGNECGEVYKISGRYEPNRKRKDHDYKSPYKNLWEAI